ncbi:hypothetical protein Ae168Ps1_2615c [Pseudonocardia sp. Ae168_Ps1]|nr:hypothetical protein Ae150APs1_2605c [Pseudonocardia sp. Ae150A_Ps1]OLL80209.1 hypothetical protein Ae168Ps1_2615c [Pseudonocardia sp. Ae168_Ps1]
MPPASSPGTSAPDPADRHRGNSTTAPALVERRGRRRDLS